MLLEGRRPPLVLEFTECSLLLDGGAAPRHSDCDMLLLSATATVRTTRSS
jgi:hypothetical protein